VELENHDLALFCERNLNNFPVFGRRLIVDFALENQRKILKREQKRESFFKKLKEKSKNKEKKSEKKEKSEQPISEINDIAKLKELLEKEKSRGRKQRIKKKLISLGAIEKPAIPAPDPPVVKMETSEPKKIEDEKPLKLAGKRPKHEDSENFEIEKEIMKAKKIKKHKKRDERRIEENKFEVFFKGTII